MNDGTVYGCGRNDYSQLGTGNNVTTNLLTQMTIPTGKIPTAISAGYIHSLVLMNDGTVYGCGFNFYGNLGTGNNDDKNELTQMTIPTGKTPAAIACGAGHSLVLMNDGTVYGCGDNRSGQLGTGNNVTTNLLTQMTIPTGKIPLAIDCGFAYSLVLMNDGTVYGCGDNSIGELGIDTNNGFSKNELTQMTIPTGKIPAAISAGAEHSLVLMNDGTVYVCGFNNNGQLGTGITAYSIRLLTQMTNNTGKIPAAISAGAYHSLVLMNDGTVYGCGRNDYSQLGIGNNVNIITELTQMLSPDGLGGVTNVITLKSIPVPTVVPVVPVISNICFPAGTPIVTNQGNISIEQLNPSIHTIRNKSIIGITQTITHDKYLVCFEKDSIGINIPSQKTIISKNHKIFFNKKMMQAKEFIGLFENVYKIKYNGEILYNVLMEDYDKMVVNNLVCETLHPDNDVAKIQKVLHLLSPSEQENLIKTYNEHVKKSDRFSSKKITK